MPFKKGDPQSLEWARQGGKAQVENRRAGFDKLTTYLRNGGSEEVERIFLKVKDGEDLTEGEKKFYDMFKDLLEWAAPKLARTEHVGDGGGPVEIKNIQELSDDDLAALANK